VSVMMWNATVPDCAEVNAQPNDDVENFEVAEFQAYLRELDAPFEHLMTA
jgi:hypothetical protein